jgi:uncharacterized protein with NRDE domain
VCGRSASRPRLRCHHGVRMCTILLAWRCLDDARYVLAANRDELRARPSAPPGVLSSSPLILGGRDLLAGGTWLAVAPEGRAAAVTNRRRGGDDEVRRDPDRRSRGELPLRVLQATNLTAALSGIRPAEHNPFNLLVVDGARAIVGHGEGDGPLDVVDLEPGAHVLCVHDVDDPAHTKERRLRSALLAALSADRAASACLGAMRRLLADHTRGDDYRDAACVHGEMYGTVSSSLLALAEDGTLLYQHAPGRPCETGFTGVPVGWP